MPGGSLLSKVMALAMTSDRFTDSIDIVFAQESPWQEYKDAHSLANSWMVILRAKAPVEIFLSSAVLVESIVVNLVEKCLRQ